MARTGACELALTLQDTAAESEDKVREKGFTWGSHSYPQASFVLTGGDTDVTQPGTFFCFSWNLQDGVAGRGAVRSS